MTNQFKPMDDIAVGLPSTLRHFIFRQVFSVQQTQKNMLAFVELLPIGHHSTDLVLPLTKLQQAAHQKHTNTIRLSFFFSFFPSHTRSFRASFHKSKEKTIDPPKLAFNLTCLIFRHMECWNKLYASLSTIMTTLSSIERKLLTLILKF